MNHWKRIDQFIGRIEKFFLLVMLGSMVLVAFLQILLRNFFDTGIPWGDSLVRYLVLWVGFIGAALATREGKHINIDVFSNWLPGIGKAVNQIIIQLFSCVICGLLTYAALKFVHNEYQMEEVVFFGLPVWLLQFIIPVTCGLMTFRYALRTLNEISALVHSDAIPEPKRDI
jgi:C4-dicarboxylate transporter DctQ subunit